jgi:hypothetical protein
LAKVGTGTGKVRQEEQRLNFPLSAYCDALLDPALWLPQAMLQER